MPIIVHQIEHWATDRLVPFAGNPRTHTREQIAQIAKSIAELGFVNPILVGPDRVIVAGHGRLLAARKLGMREVPVIVLSHLTEAQRRALVIADNQLALSAGWDEEKLRQELTALQDQEFPLDLIGFDETELERLLATADSADGLADENAIPAVPPAPITAPGDLWILGEQHRVLCGDAAQSIDVERLMAGEKADLVFTDLPYNVDYTGRTKDHLKIQGDHMTPEEFRGFLASAFTSYSQVVKASTSLYVCHPWSWQREFQNALEAAGFTVRCQIIWVKDAFGWGFARYRYQHEPIFYAHVAEQNDCWYGDRSQSTVWQENRPLANDTHPTAKPVGLVERALVNSSRRGDLIVDLFGGSGSTLIACQRLGRRSRLLEIDPRYVDVTVRRWQDFTGESALLAGDGRSFAEVRDDREGEGQEVAA